MLFLPRSIASSETAWYGGVYSTILPLEKWLHLTLSASLQRDASLRELYIHCVPCDVFELSLVTAVAVAVVITWEYSCTSTTRVCWSSSGRACRQTMLRYTYFSLFLHLNLHIAILRCLKAPSVEDLCMHRRTFVPPVRIIINFFEVVSALSLNSSAKYSRDPK